MITKCQILSNSYIDIRFGANVLIMKNKQTITWNIETLMNKWYTGQDFSGTPIEWYLDSIEPNLEVIILPFLEFFYFNHGLAHPFILTSVSP
jgi:hypothetical protein